MARTKGATDKGKRVRPTETDEQRATKAKKKTEAEAEQRKQHKIEGAQKRATFFLPRSHSRTDDGGGVGADDGGGASSGGGADSGGGAAGAPEPAAEHVDEMAGAPEPAAEHADEMAEARLEDVEAELDDDEQLNDAVDTGSVMGVFLEAALKRMQAETTGTRRGDAWLLQHLKEKEWWLRASRAKDVCAKLGIDFGEPAYYRDVFVWLPDERWGMEATPACPSCRSSADVRVHGWVHDHFGRRVCGLSDHYYVQSRRYICRGCEKDAKTARAEATATATGLGLAVEETTSDGPLQYTFMAYDARSRELLPFGYGDEFPAFLTKRGGVDLALIDMMRPLFDKGLRPEAFSRTLLELHTKRYTKAYIQREHLLARDRRLDSRLPAAMFSSFADKKGYAGLVPTGNYLAHVYKLYGDTIEEHLGKEVKKRGARRLSWDASYKEAKHLGRYHSESIFKALVTATNELGEIRLQFHVVSDAHDQMAAPIGAFLDTMNAYGMEPTELLCTDKPSDDKVFFMDAIPSLRTKQNELVAPPAPHAPALPLATIDAARYKICRSASEINTAVGAARDLVKALPLNRRVMSLDAEWDVEKNAAGFITGHGTVALVQLSYQRSPDDEVRALVLQVSGKARLPDRLLALLADPAITFVGRQINGDLSKIATDFNCEQIRNTRRLELGSMARARDVVQNGAVGLDKLVQATLGERLSKAPEVRCSNWSATNLTEEQQQYAALDVIKAHEVYLHLVKLPDLTARLAPADVKIDALVDVVPSHGCVAVMATRAATGTIQAPAPTGIAPRAARRRNSSRLGRAAWCR